MTRKRKMRRLDELRPHPAQAEMFGDVPDAELQALKADMEAHGLRQPVEILPDGTIIGGHPRVDAAKILGWEEIEVEVRHDLTDDTEGKEEL